MKALKKGVYYRLFSGEVRMWHDCSEHEKGFRVELEQKKESRNHFLVPLH